MTTKPEEGRAIVALEDGLVYADEVLAALEAKEAEAQSPLDAPKAD
jgi:hypothetical protein